MELRDRVALVTGASRGVGRAVAIALAEAGADVACAARATDDAPLKLPGTIDDTVRQVEAAGRRGLALPTNLAVEAEVERMVRRTIEHFGRIDILINNAAITFPGDLQLPMKRYDLIMAVNLRAVLQATQLAAEDMKRRRTGGAIINVSSAAGLHPYPGLMAYGMSKAAMERMSVDVAAQLRPYGIAVNTFRIDVPVASEGFVANLPDVDHDDWEPTEVPAEGIVWMLRQSDYTGHNVGMVELRAAHGIMPSRSKRPFILPAE
jgi:NAD(P)-dependent dehydrogenase (short-subunit alcohol dehydrogenase family)